MSKTFDIDEQFAKEKRFTKEDHLEAILFQFVNLYERWSEDRQVTAKQSADIAQFVKTFVERVNQFGSLEEKVRKDIQTCIRKEAENTATYFSQTIGEAAKKEVEPTVRKLRETVDQSERTLSKYQTSVGFANWYIVILSIASSIFASLFIVWMLMPKPMLPLTNQQIHAMQIGNAFSELWPKLSKSEKERLKKLVNQYGI